MGTYLAVGVFFPPLPLPRWLVPPPLGASSSPEASAFFFLVCTASALVPNAARLRVLLRADTGGERRWRPLRVVVFEDWVVVGIVCSVCAMWRLLTVGGGGEGKRLTSQGKQPYALMTN